MEKILMPLANKLARALATLLVSFPEITIMTLGISGRSPLDPQYGSPKTYHESGKPSYSPVKVSLIDKAMLFLPAGKAKLERADWRVAAELMVGVQPSA